MEKKKDDVIIYRYHKICMSCAEYRILWMMMMIIPVSLLPIYFCHALTSFSFFFAALDNNSTVLIFVCLLLCKFVWMHCHFSWAIVFLLNHRNWNEMKWKIKPSSILAILPTKNRISNGNCLTFSLSLSWYIILLSNWLCRWFFTLKKREKKIHIFE